MAARIRSTASSLVARSGAKPPSSPMPVDLPCVLQQRAQRVERLDAHPQRLGERGRVVRGDLEFLEVDGIVRVPAAVDDVEAGDRQHRGLVAAEVAVERHAGRTGRCARRRHRDAEDRIGAEPRLVGRAVELDEALVERLLVGGVAPGERPVDLAVDVGNGLPHPLAAVARAAVAQLGRLALAGRCARRHARHAGGPVAEMDPRFHGRIAAGIDHLECVNRTYRANCQLPFLLVPDLFD